MAGVGSRFAESGYTLPKALIPVSGQPMIVQVIRSLPAADKWIFIVRAEHIADYAIDVLIRREIPEAIVIPVSETTEGQASTCALALPHLKPDESIFIAASDNSFLYDKNKFEALKKDDQVDAIVWTFTKHPALSERPESWGWIKLQSDNVTIEDVSVKIPISATPFNDHAVVGTFYFRRAADFQAAYELMVKTDYRTKGEFYVDSMPVFYKKLDKRSILFDVDLYVGWGKPEDLYAYQEWEYKVKNDIGTRDPARNLWNTFIHSL